MNMKDMIQRMTDLENGAKQQLNEDCGTMPAMPPANPGSPVSMNISLNASGKEHVEDLINMMKNAGMSGAQEVMSTMMPMRMDMERLRDVVDGPRMPGQGADNRPSEEYMDAEELMAGGDDLHAEKDPADIRVKDPSGYESAEEGYDNEPDEQYDDHETMIHDLSGGINRQKKMYKKAADGDSDMAVESIKDQLYAMLSEKKAKPDFLDIDGDGDTKEPMKKAAKDAGKDKGSKPKKGVVPPQFKKK